MVVARPAPAARVRESFAVHPVVALTGPRQCGKTTLARAIAADSPGSTYFDLEAAIDRRRLATPEQALGSLRGLVVVDEVQRMPGLFETVRMLVDRSDNHAQFLLLGSASPSLVKGVAESLAGRVGLVDLPKIYVRDSGLLHTLLDVAREHDLAGHPKVGASFEGFAIEQLLAALQTPNAYFWATHAGAELDLLVVRGGKRYGFECKRSDAPGVTRSMRVAFGDLGLERLWIIYPGDESYPLDDRISVLTVADIPGVAAMLGR